MLHIHIQWKRPVVLQEDHEGSLLYKCNLDRFWSDPGLYVFCRQWGSHTVPVYVGQATNVHHRVKQQLNNLRLMMSLYKSGKAGRRVVLHGYLVRRPGQTTKKALDITERACIERAMTAGYDLVNFQGTKRKYHTVDSSGNRAATGLFGRTMNVGRR